jgi:hypothetical protein
MNLDNWNVFYKYNGLDRTSHNSVYVPYINSDKTVYCMDYSKSSSFFFENESRWLQHIQHEDYAPEILDIDNKNKHITFKWYNTSINHLIFNHTSVELEKVNSVLAKLEKQNILKLNFFPHTCFVDKHDNIRVHDFYACASANNPMIEMEKIQSVLGNIQKFFYAKHETNGLVNLKNVYAELITQNRGDWPQCLSTTLVMY